MSHGTSGGDGLVGVVLQDSFRLTRLIGRGGMGTVYEGTQLRLNKRVAVKLLARELASNQEALARFRREAEVTSQLGHPHIVQVFDFGTAPSGEPYLVMEYLEGEDLDKRIRRAGRLPLTSVVSVVRQVASALSSTHARGIVHRDLKPANIFVLEIEGETDFVKVVDFGISKVRAASVKLTNASAVMGTPNYMSPEQALGQVEEIDHRTDQWALACIAYEMISGRGPFVGDSVHSLLYQVIHEEPPKLTTLVQNLPAEIETVIRRGLAKRQADRFPTMNAFARALAAAVTSTAVSSGSSSASPPARGAGLASDPTLPASAAPAASASPGPQVTTLSRTASELLTPLSRLRSRVKPKWAAASAGVAAVLALLILWPRSSPPTARPITITPHAAPSPIVAPSVMPIAPPSGAPPPAQPTPTPLAATPEEPGPAILAPSRPTRETRKKRAVVADPFADEGGAPNEKPSKTKLAPGALRPIPATPPASKVAPSTGPKRHLIEDL